MNKPVLSDVYLCVRLPSLFNVQMLLGSMQTNKDTIQTKIFAPEDLHNLRKALDDWRVKKKSLVFTNGCFDILHLGHIDYLAQAADFGDVLIVGLNTDSSVRNIKGPNRPVNSQNARAALLASLFFVDAVVMFDKDTPYELIKEVQPDFLIKGSDYKEEDIVGNDIVRSKNGRVIAVDLLKGYSTTNIIRKLTS